MTTSWSDSIITAETIMEAIEALGPMPPRIRLRYSKMLDEFNRGFLLGHALDDLQVWCVPESWRAKLEEAGAETATERDIDAVTIRFDWLKLVKEHE